MEYLRSRSVRNYCGITKIELYNQARVGTKKLIEDYIDVVCQAFQFIAEYNDPEINIKQKLQFFNECRHGKLNTKN